MSALTVHQQLTQREGGWRQRQIDREINQPKGESSPSLAPISQELEIYTYEATGFTLLFACRVFPNTWTLPDFTYLTASECFSGVQMAIFRFKKYVSVSCG